MRPIIRVTRYLGRKPIDRKEFRKVWRKLKTQPPLWKQHKLEYDRAYQRARYKSKIQKPVNRVVREDYQSYLQFLQKRGLDFEL